MTTRKLHPLENPTRWGIACSHPNGTDNTFSGVDMKKCT